MPLVLILALGVQLQTPTAGCTILDRNSPPHYLTYERFGDADEKGHSRHLVWLRFHNNTSCDVHLLGGRRGPLGSVTKDGDEWVVNYSVIFKNGRGPFCWECSDDQGVATLPEGDTAVFSVLHRHFVVGEMIAVTFEYVWEDLWGIIPAGARFVVFETATIPEADRRKFRK